MRYALAITVNQRDRLEKILFSSAGHEGAAYLICGVARIKSDPWTGSGVRRLIVREVHPVEQIVSRSVGHVTWNTNDFIRLTARCEREGLTILIAHNHPEHIDSFSLIDDKNEARLFSYALDKLGDCSIVGSVLMRPDRSLVARVWIDNPVRHEPIETILTTGDTWCFETTQRTVHRDALQRQELALGHAFNESIKPLRVGVVGNGATGSATGMMLARLGVGHIALFDRDEVDATNLHRLHGAGQSDADAGRVKSEVLRDAIAALGLGCKVRSIPYFAESVEARDALRSCDVIFSCTDDHLGRAVLNRFAYFYLIPVIDVGVVLRLNDEKTRLTHVDGRVTVLQPGTPCLFCHGVLSPRKIAGDSARRGDPEQFERLKAEGYIIGGGDPSPAVITFTTETASMGLNELIQRLTQFRGADGAVNQWMRHFLEGEDKKSVSASRPECRICGRETYWGRGDCEPFLDMSL